MWTDATIFGGTLLGLLILSIWFNFWEGFTLNTPAEIMTQSPVWSFLALVAIAVGAGYVHFAVRKLAARLVGKKLGADIQHTFTRESLGRAFAKNTGPFHSIFTRRPLGWGQFVRRRIARVLSDADGYVQALNDQFTNPSGTAKAATASPAPLPLAADEQPSATAEANPAVTRPSQADQQAEGAASTEAGEASAKREAAVQ